MDAKLLRELQDRGRFFYETFPGAAGAEEWKRNRERAEDEYANRLSGNQRSHHLDNAKSIVDRDR
jgi:hypothetical protein